MLAKKSLAIILLALIVLLSGCSQEAKRKRQEARAQKISDSLMQVAQDSVDYFKLVHENYFSGKVFMRNLIAEIIFLKLKILSPSHQRT